MIITIIFFIGSLAIILLGANLLTDGASALARRFDISELVIGLTIVALGTSLPEFVISLGSALKGSSGISLGNIIGSNIFNGLLILGVAALIYPIKFSKKMLSREIPFNLLSAIALTLVSGSMIYAVSCEGEYISRTGGLLLLCFLAIFIRYTFSIAKDDNADESEEKIALMIKLADANYIDGDKDKAFSLYEEIYNNCIVKGFDKYLEEDWFSRLKGHYKANKKLDKIFKIKLGKTL